MEQWYMLLFKHLMIVDSDLQNGANINYETGEAQTISFIKYYSAIKNLNIK